MKTTIFILCLHSLAYTSKSQTPRQLIRDLTTINNKIIGTQGSKSMAISNRAMNLFLLDKTSYVFEKTDVSFYTNYVTLNGLNGTLSVNHNFHTLKGFDEPVNHLFSAGLSASAVAPFAINRPHDDPVKELGVNISNKWIGKTRTHFSGAGNNTGKGLMNVLRTTILADILRELQTRTADLEKDLAQLESTTVLPTGKTDSTEAAARQHFNKELSEEYNEKFAWLQAEALTKTKSFHHITTCWTTMSAYVPLISEKFYVTNSLPDQIQGKRAYAGEIIVGHTRFLESAKTGRFFFTISGNVKLNNSRQSLLLDKMSVSGYRNAGGTDSVSIRNMDGGNIYVGSYKRFITPSVCARFAYFPPDSHVGLVVQAEQNFGIYKALNARIGVPVVLINKKRLPALNLEFSAYFLDLNNKILKEKKIGDKTSIYLTAGIPFSRMIF